MASAATVRVEQTDFEATLAYEAEVGEANDVAVELVSHDPDGNRYLVRDASAPLAAGDGCTEGGSPGTTAVCLLPQSRVDSYPVGDFGLRVLLSFDLGDQSDALDGTNLPASDGGGDNFSVSVSGGEGDDLLVTGASRDRVDPGTGTDTVRSNGGDDWVDPGPAADGADRYEFGEGSDTISYVQRTASVTVDLQDPHDSGAESEHDSLVDVERVGGGQAADLLAGTSSRDILWGGNGQDTIIGRGGPDSMLAAPLQDTGQTIPRTDEPVTVRGGGGADIIGTLEGSDDLRGGAGRDIVWAGGGDDRVVGGRGADTLFGEHDSDDLRGGRGNDRIDPSLDGFDVPDEAADRVNCGPARHDVALSLDAEDHARHCEQVERL